MHQYIKELVDRIDNTYATDSVDMSLGDWICENTHLRSRPFTFERYPFQKQIADDLHPNMDVVKPSQIGLTEIQIRKALAFLHRNRGTSLIFTLPTDDMFERLSKGRIMPIVRDEKVFNLGEDKVTRSKGLMQIGTSFLYITGAKEGDATSISADVVFNDEIDLTNQKMLGLFNSRLQNSDWKINQRFSTPTFYGFGIDAGFKASDQHEYMCKCDACNHWNIPIFERRFIDIPGLPDSTGLLEIDNALAESGRLDLLNSSVVCEKCRAPLDLGRTEAREWVPRFASRKHHRGYRVSPFSTDRLSIQYIVTQLLQYRRRDYMRGFHNTVLGQAYTAGAAQLNDAEIDAVMTPIKSEPALDPVMPTWIGIDVGKTCHMIVSQGFNTTDQKIMRWKTLSPEKMLEEVKIVFEQCNVIGGACDRHPYTPTAEAVRDITRGKVLPVEYRGQKTINLIKDELDEKITHAQVNRTAMIDGFVKMIRNRGVAFMGYLEQAGTIKEHLKDMVRDEQPEKPATWIKLHGNDHYFHAGAFLYSAIKLKELELGKYTDNRGTVAMLGANLGQVRLGLHKNQSKAFLGT